MTHNFPQDILKCNYNSYNDYIIIGNDFTKEFLDKNY